MTECNHPTCEGPYGICEHPGGGPCPEDVPRIPATMARSVDFTGTTMARTVLATEDQVGVLIAQLVGLRNTADVAARAACNADDRATFEREVGRRDAFDFVVYKLSLIAGTPDPVAPLIDGALTVWVPKRRRKWWRKKR